MPKELPPIKERWSFSFFRAVIFSIIGLIIILISLRRITNPVLTDVDYVLFLLIPFCLGLLYLAYKEHRLLSGFLLVSLIWLIASYIMWTGKGVFDAVVVAYLAIILITILLLDWKIALVFLIATLASIWLNAIMMMKGVYVPEPRDTVFNYTRDITVIMLTVALLSQFFLKQLNENLKRLANELYERKRIERALRASEENYRLLFEQAAEGILIADSSGNVLLTNEGFSKMSGYSREEIVSKNISMFFKAEELQMNPLRYDLADKGDVIIRKRSLLRKDGKTLEVESRSKKMADGRLQAFVSDISERTKAEKSLRDFERIFNLSANPICIANLDGTLTKVNPAFSKSLGYTEKEIVGKKIFDFMLKEDIKSTVDYVKNQVKAKVDLLQLENRYVARNGSIVWFSWMTQPIYEENISFSVAHDITRIKRVETELITAKEKAEESDRLKTAFLENMSHEIRTPLNGIIGFSELFLEPELSSYDREHYARILINSGQKLLAILNDILDISRIETGQLEISNEEVNINHQLDELYQLFLPKASEKKLDYTLKKDLPDTNAITLTDKIRLHQIISNLLVNAFKFTEKGFVHFGYRFEDNYFKFFVEDSGVGIDKKMHNKIFERFMQANIDISKSYGGTGLGLSISQKLALLLGGKIDLESETGKGSTFYFSLPMVHPTGKSESTLSGPTASFNKTKEKQQILLVEDDEVNYEYLNAVLTKAGYIVIPAMDGKQAIEYVEKNDTLQLVLMDIKLPLVDGYEATKKIKEIRPNLPVIAQTAYAMTTDREKALKAGCNDYIAKPVAADALVRIVEKYIKKA
jgi:PAS domain S-box-containing protein